MRVIPSRVEQPVGTLKRVRDANQRHRAKVHMCVTYSRVRLGFNALPYIIKNLSSFRLLGADAGIDGRHALRTAAMNIATVSR